MLNQKPFQHKITSEIECDKENFPKQAFEALVNFVDLEECLHLLWKTHKYAMCAESYMEAEERTQLYQYYEAVHDVLEAVFMMRKTQPVH